MKVLVNEGGSRKNEREQHQVLICNKDSKEFQMLLWLCRFQREMLWQEDTPVKTKAFIPLIARRVGC